MGSPLSFRTFAIISFVLLSLLLSAGISLSTDDEFQLLKEGYEHFFSYRPEKAAETFKSFLDKFPESSAKDAAMFWLGKSFVQLKYFDEAERLFAEVKQNYPESPFKQFIDSELEEITKMKSAARAKEEKIITDVAKDRDIRELADSRKPLEIEKGLAEAIDGRNKLKALLDDEIKKSEEMKAKVTVLTARESELRGRIDELEGQMKRWTESEKSLSDFKTEKNSLLLENKRLIEETVQMVKERDELKDKVKKYEDSTEADLDEKTKIRVVEMEKKNLVLEKDLSRKNEEKENLKALFDEEKAKAQGLKENIIRLREKESEYISLLLKVEEEQKNLREAKENIRKLGNEKESLESEIIIYKDFLNAAAAEKNVLANKLEEMEKRAYQREKDMNILNSYLTHLMFQKKPEQTEKEIKKGIEERDTLKVLLDEEKVKTGELKVRIAGIEAREMQIIGYMTNAAVVLHKLGIREVLWRTGDIYNDFVAEQVLFDEAIKAGIVLQPGEYKELAEKYGLNKEESDYLRRYMTIGSLAIIRAGDVKEDMIIEVLLVEYGRKITEKKKTLATELQKQASSGKSFEDIQKMYPDLVRFYRVDIPEFSRKFREESKVIQKISPNQGKPISVWTEKGYMILKPLSRKQSYNIFDDIPPEKKEKIRAFLKKWLDELKSRPVKISGPIDFYRQQSLSRV